MVRMSLQSLIFLSTLSLRRATCYSLRHSASCRHFYPRSPCGERLDKRCKLSRHNRFLSTLSLRRATVASLLAAGGSRYFYPRSPCGERLHYDNYNLHCVEISIHALLAESDCAASITPTTSRNFYPRSPCGERLHYDNYNLHCVEISIHALLAESDQCLPGFCRMTAEISIHALLAESDGIGLVFLWWGVHFYPRSPCGERPFYPPEKPIEIGISIHALLAESDVLVLCSFGGVSISIHALLAESDFEFYNSLCQGTRFLSTLSLRRATGGGYSHFMPSNDFYPRSPCGERH